MINKTLGVVLSTKICNYSWEGTSKEVSQREQVNGGYQTQVLTPQDVEQRHQN
ncbi:MAG: hypothetical protein RMX96_16180 [Nostoc sp. ChiSLP02]|nr:hypothetical protein [Nostoc sp. DedSLP01]MDZ8186374.1 hypothetical protein [Nostoc sp. ChiSLP02]